MIRIKNIFHMLAYAFKALDEEKDSYAKIQSEDFEYAEDLLAAILAKGMADQIKRGLGRGYVLHTESTTTPHGKINISESLKTQSLLKKQLVCEFDIFSENIYVNRVLKTTATVLIRSDKVEEERKKALKRVLLYFSTVDLLNYRKIRWSEIEYHRNNEIYRMLINICYFALESLLPTTDIGQKKISRFRDEALHELFERFVREYYRKHYPQFGVSASYIDWNLDDDNIELLPVMKTDITIEYMGKTLIIDTKYYNKIIRTNPLYNTRTIHSGNLYQIFSYVKNKDVKHNGNVSGLLLYAKTDESVTPDNRYSIDGNTISVKTVDLDKEFSNIRKQLDDIIEEWLKKD